MGTLSRTEIASLASGAGWVGNDVNIAVAVALAESSGNPHDHNSKPPDDSYGLWQINMLGSMGPARRKQFNLKSNSDLFDPATNARVAHGIWAEHGWQPWTTYTHGIYKQFMNGSDASTASDTVTATPPDTSGNNGGLFGIGSAINSFSSTVTKGFASFGAILVVVALLALGFIILLRNQVSSVVPGGNIAKVAKVAKGIAK